jgi:ubiquinone/menaquinone biosynthesis C-methylase UbiE
MGKGLAEGVTSLTPSEWHTRFTEQARWTANLRSYLFTRLGLPGAGRILEVGCGTGAILGQDWRAKGLQEDTLAEDDSAQHPQSPTIASSTVYAQEDNIYGLDISLEHLRLCALHVPFARLTQGDAHTLPYSDASFEAVFCHFLLLWLSQPAAALAEMRRVTRPGGFVLALAEPDYGGRIDFPPGLEPLGRSQQDSLLNQGADPQVGRKLAALFSQVGLLDVEVGVLGGQWRLGDLSSDLSEQHILADDLRGRLADRELQRLFSLDSAARAAGQRILFVPTFYAWGVVPS